MPLGIYFGRQLPFYGLPTYGSKENLEFKRKILGPLAGLGWLRGRKAGSHKKRATSPKKGGAGRFLGRKRGAELLFFRVSFFLQTPKFQRQLLLEGLQLLGISRLPGPLNLLFQKQLPFGDASPKDGVDLGKLGFLLSAQSHRRRLFLQAFHGELIGRFHFKAFYCRGPLRQDQRGS